MELTQEKIKPYLSIITTSRNDNHGGDMLRRMQISINSMLEQFELYKLESELILVEWNPPTEKPSLITAFPWRNDLKYCSVRIINIPNSIHKKYRYSDRLPINVTVAVNTGVRRSKGDFIISRAIDTIFSNELVEFIARKNLKENTMYRVDRYDVKREVTNYTSLKDQLDFCKNNVININKHLQNKTQFDLPDLYTNASGDFQLMSRKNWLLLRGLREADIVAAHVDGLLSYAAYASGVKEVCLEDPFRLYHIDHEGKFNEKIRNLNVGNKKWWDLSFLRFLFNADLKNLRSATRTEWVSGQVKGIPTLSYDQYLRLCQEVVNGKRSYVYNGNNWGLGTKIIPVVTISRAYWDQASDLEER